MAAMIFLRRFSPLRPATWALANGHTDLCEHGTKALSQFKPESGGITIVDAWDPEEAPRNIWFEVMESAAKLRPELKPKLALLRKAGYPGGISMEGLAFCVVSEAGLFIDPASRMRLNMQLQPFERVQLVTENDAISFLDWAVGRTFDTTRALIQQSNSTSWWRSWADNSIQQVVTPQSRATAALCHVAYECCADGTAASQYFAARAHAAGKPQKEDIKWACECVREFTQLSPHRIQPDEPASRDKRASRFWPAVYEKLVRGLSHPTIRAP